MNLLSISAKPLILQTPISQIRNEYKAEFEHKVNHTVINLNETEQCQARNN